MAIGYPTAAADSTVARSHPGRLRETLQPPELWAVGGAVSRADAEATAGGFEINVTAAWPARDQEGRPPHGLGPGGLGAAAPVRFRRVRELPLR